MSLMLQSLTPGLDRFWLILFYLFISVALVDSQLDAYWLVLFFFGRAFQVGWLLVAYLIANLN